MACARSTAVFNPVMTASPAAMPSEPPMKSKSCTPTTTGRLFDLAGRDPHRVLHAGLGARILEAVGVTALVTELERIERHLRQRISS